MGQKERIEHLTVNPPIGLSSPHIQTVLGYIAPYGIPPPSTQSVIKLEDGDRISCEVSIPSGWKAADKTIILLHGLGGSHNSPYMIRLSRKFYQKGSKVIRVNMRGCGSGEGLTAKPYHGGLTADVLTVLKTLQLANPISPMILIGFSLGGNIALKLAGELGIIDNKLLALTIAVCPPMDLAHSSALLARASNRAYNKYYMNHLKKQAEPWLKGRMFLNLYEFDCLVTAPLWGFQGAFDYYQQCSSRFLIHHIKSPCRILFSADDPFIDYKVGMEFPLPPSVTLSLANCGGHLGFIGWAEIERDYFWMDQQLIQWVQEY